MNPSPPTKSPPFYDYRTGHGQSKGIIWRDFHAWRNERLPAKTRRWLLDQGSLTQRLLQASHHCFSVQVLRQQFQRVPLADSQLLRIPAAQACLVREVALLCAGEPWVYARSVMPCTSLTGKLRHLRHFDNRSLGELLFTTPGMQRNPFQLARVPAVRIPLSPQIASTEPLWGRRSRFLLYNKPLLVSETFLPAFRPWTQ